MTTPEPAYMEEQASNNNSEDENPKTVASSKVSATKQKEEKRKHKKDTHKSPRKERGPARSDDGTILNVEKTDDLVASIDRLRVKPDHKEARRKPANSAPVDGERSPRKSSIRPQQRDRGHSVTFEKELPRHNKDDPSYFAHKGNEGVKYSPNKSSSSHPRPPLASLQHDMRPHRPVTFQGHLPVHYPQQFASPAYASPMAFATPPVDPYAGASYFPPTNRMADRFGRTGQPTLNDAPLPDLAPSRRQSEYYPHEDHEEHDYRFEDERRHTHAELQKRRQKDLARKAKEIEQREQLLLEEEQTRERARVRDLIRLEERDKLEREQREREYRKRIEDSMAMPPPPGLPRRTSSQRQRPYTPEVPSMEEMRAEQRRQKRSSRDAADFGPLRPKVTHHQTEPLRPPRRPSFTTPSASSGGYDLHRQHRPNVLEVSGNRHSSFYAGTSGAGTSTTSSDYEEQVRRAMQHQDQVAREAPGLTEALLEKQQKTIAGSRSTRSTASRDESDYNNKRSIDTRTTRSGSGDGHEGLTLVINGTASMKINGAEVNTRESDGPVEISINQATKAIRNGSEVASESAYAPSRMSGSTAVSDDFMDASRPRSRNPRRETISSHQSHSRQKPSFDDGRLPRSSTEQRLRDRMSAGPSLGRRNSVRGTGNAMDFERWP